MQQKSYLDYAKAYLNGQGSLEDQQAYKRKQLLADYIKYANEFKINQNKQTIDNLTKEKNKALAENEIASERARRYVDAVNKHYGIAGTGYGASKAIDIYCEFSNKRHEINENFNKQKTEILNNSINSSIDNEIDYAKLLNEAYDEQGETLASNENLLVDFLFSILSEDELKNLPYTITNIPYFDKKFIDKFIKKPMTWD